MKNKIIVLVLAGFLGLYMAPALLANSQGQDHRTYPEFKPLRATDVEIVKKVSLTTPQKGKPADISKKPVKDEVPVNIATGILGDTAEGSRFAIIIGISDYPGDANDLKYTDNDALAMRNVLVDKYNFADGNIYLLTDGDAAETANQNGFSVYGLPNASNIQNAILEIGGLVTSGDEVVFFFSGHGGKGKASDGDSEVIDESIISHDGTYLVPIWDGQLKQLFAGYATDRIVFFFDSCVSGGMTDLAVLGRIINMATWETRFDTAVEGVYGDESIGAGEFTYYFVIKGMGEGLADITGTEGVVTVEEAFDYAKASVIIDHPTVSDGFIKDLLL